MKPVNRLKVRSGQYIDEGGTMTPVLVVLAYMRALALRLHRDESGYTTETVLVTALLVALALVVIGLIVAVVTRKAQSIQF